jgi:hypothetical protein
MSQLNLNFTQPTNITQTPPFILRSTMATMASQTVIARPSQRSGGEVAEAGEGLVVEAAVVEVEEEEANRPQQCQPLILSEMD